MQALPSSRSGQVLLFQVDAQETWATTFLIAPRSVSSEEKWISEVTEDCKEWGMVGQGGKKQRYGLLQGRTETQQLCSASPLWSTRHHCIFFSLPSHRHRHQLVTMPLKDLERDTIISGFFRFTFLTLRTVPVLVSAGTC